MAWESRGAQTYYYRSVKRGGRVIKTYMGKGPFVAMLVAEVEQERAERQAKAEAWRKARTDMEALDAQMHEWWDTGSAIIDTYLTAHGYYRHDRGDWRKRADPQKLRQLLTKANKGDTQAFDYLSTRLDATAWFWEKAGNMSTQVQETLLIEYLGKDALLTHEAQRRKCAALRRDLAGATPTPLETLLVDRLVLCWLHLHLVEAFYAQNMQRLSIQQLDFHERRVSLSQRRYLNAIHTLAQVRRLQVPAVQVNIAEQQLNVAAITPAQPHQHHAERSAR